MAFSLRYGKVLELLIDHVPSVYIALAFVHRPTTEQRPGYHDQTVEVVRDIIYVNAKPRPVDRKERMRQAACHDHARVGEEDSGESQR